MDWLVQAGFEPAVAEHPALRQTFTFDRRRMGRPAGWPSLLTLLNALRQQQYNQVYDLQGLARSAFFTRMTKCPQRIGFANAREGGSFAYNRKYHVDANIHAVDRMMGLLAAHGLNAEEPNLQLYTAQADREWIDREHPALAAEPYACIAPAARWRCKCWPIEHYITIARRLLATGVAGRRLVILASPAEQEIIKPLLDAFGEDARVVWPRTTVGQLMALIERCRLLVCNDSAPLHIAVGFGRPIATIFGPTDPRLVGPYRRDDTVLQPPGIGDALLKDYRRKPDDQSLIARVTEERVWNTIEQQVARQS